MPVGFPGNLRLEHGELGEVRSVLRHRVADWFGPRALPDINIVAQWPAGARREPEKENPRPCRNRGDEQGG